MEETPKIEWFQSYEQKGRNGKDTIWLKNEWETIYERLKDGWMKSDEASKTLDEMRNAVKKFNDNRVNATEHIDEKKFDEKLNELVWKLNDILTKWEILWEDLKVEILSKLDVNKLSPNVQVAKKWLWDNLFNLIWYLKR